MNRLIFAGLQEEVRVGLQCADKQLYGAWNFSAAVAMFLVHSCFQHLPMPGDDLSKCVTTWTKVQHVSD